MSVKYLKTLNAMLTWEALEKAHVVVNFMCQLHWTMG